MAEGVKLDLVNKSGTWYSIGEERIGQGVKNASNWLRENPEISKKIEKQILQGHGIITKEEPKPETKRRVKKEEVKEEPKKEEIKK